MKKRLIVDIICYFLILLFLYTALMKIVDYQVFKWDLHKSPFIRGYAPIVAIGLPIIELGIAASLFIARFRRWGLYSSLFLMSFFSLYVWYMLTFTPDRPCTCGGIIRAMSWHAHLYFNIGSVVAIWIGIKLMNDRVAKGASASLLI